MIIGGHLLLPRLSYENVSGTIGPDFLGFHRYPSICHAFISHASKQTI